MTDTVEPKNLTAEAERYVRMNGDELISVSQALEELPVRVNAERFRRAARSARVNILNGRQMMVRRKDIDVVLRAMPCSSSRKDPIPTNGKSKACVRTPNDLLEEAQRLLSEVKPTTSSPRTSTRREKKRSMVAPAVIKSLPQP